MCMVHTHTGGSILTAQQPLNNVVRVTLQALAAVLGGTNLWLLAPMTKL